MPRIGKGTHEGHQGQKDLSTKGHEGRRRATKALEETQEDLPRTAKWRRDIQEKAKGVIHEGSQRGWKRLDRCPRRARRDPRRTGKGQKELSTKGHEERRRATKALEETQEGLPRFAKWRRDIHEKAKRVIHEGSQRGWKRLERDPRRTGKGQKEISTKGREGPRRATKALEETQEGLPRFAKWRRDIHEKAKRVIHEGSQRGWKRLERDPRRTGKG